MWGLPREIRTSFELGRNKISDWQLLLNIERISLEVFIIVDWNLIINLQLRIIATRLSNLALDNGSKRVALLCQDLKYWERMPTKGIDIDAAVRIHETWRWRFKRKAFRLKLIGKRVLAESSFSKGRNLKAKRVSY